MNLPRATTIVAAVLLALSPIAQAGSLQLHTASEHIGEGSFNERNTGLGYSIDDWVVGFYYNSIERTSVYAGRRIGLEPGLTLTLGAVTGYRKSPLPMATISYRILDTRLSPLVTYMPSKSGGVMLLSFDWRIKR